LSYLRRQVSRKSCEFVLCLYSSKQKNDTLYIGVTNDLIRRVSEHKSGQLDGLTKKYKVNQLVYFEDTDDIDAALAREKQLKRWKRSWKLRLIEKDNPEWRDLYQEMMGGQGFHGFPSAREWHSS
jgi:putative endonuclease